MSEEILLRTLRAMAWQRAKGEMQALLYTFWNDQEQFNAMNDAIESFVKDVEDNGWAS